MNSLFRRLVLAALTSAAMLWAVPAAIAQCGIKEIAALLPVDLANGDKFGSSVSINGNVVAVSARGDDCASGVNCGSVYVYRHDGNSWTEEQKISLSGATASTFDWVPVVQVEGDLAVVGAPGESCAGGDNCGAAYIFRYNGTSWLEEARLIAPNGDEFDYFGKTVSISGNMVVIGAPVDECPTTGFCGAVYVFRQNGAQWSFEAKVQATDALDVAHFGWVVSATANRFAVGAYHDNCFAGAACGAAYVFRQVGNSWIQEKKLTAPVRNEGDQFGISVALQNDQLAVGSSGLECDEGLNCGAAYIYSRVGFDWVLSQTLIPSDIHIYAYFGEGLAIDGGIMAVGATGAGWAPDGSISGGPCGAIYIFRKNGGVWTQESKLTATNAKRSSWFGSSISIDGTLAVAGAPFRHCSPGNAYCGAANIVDLDHPIDTLDCNFNGIYDECEIVECTIGDVSCGDSDGDGVLNACEVSLPDGLQGYKNRYVSFAPNPSLGLTAWRMEKLGMTGPGSAVGGCWVGAPDAMGNAKCILSPVFRMWNEPVIHLGDCEIIPATRYWIRPTADGEVLGAPHIVDTVAEPVLNGKKWGDLVGVNNGSEWTPPNQFTNIHDILAVLAFISNAPIMPTFQQANLQEVSAGYPCLNAFVNVADVLILVMANAGGDYPFTTNPGDCWICP